MMNLGEKILLLFADTPREANPSSEEAEWTMDNALSLLEQEYPDFATFIRGKKVVDFGCGLGFQSVALVAQYHCKVVGVDSNVKSLQKAKELSIAADISNEQLSFYETLNDDFQNQFDVVISQNSFEHFGDPQGILDLMISLLNKEGKLLISFGPPWFAPRGSHMQFFCKIPWVNLLFSEKSIMSARSHFRTDGARKYHEVESGLNQMTVAKFERIIAEKKLTVEFKKYTALKHLPILSSIPFMRELFINHISVILAKS